jgi:hypothetical protein
MAQNNDQVARLILLGMTGGGMYHSSMSCFLKYKEEEYSCACQGFSKIA